MPSNGKFSASQFCRNLAHIPTSKAVAIIFQMVLVIQKISQPPRCVVVVPTFGCLPTEASLVAVRGGGPLTFLCYVDTATTAQSILVF